MHELVLMNFKNLKKCEIKENAYKFYLSQNVMWFVFFEEVG